MMNLMKKRAFRIIVAAVMCLIIAVTFMPQIADQGIVNASSGKTKTMTLYDKIVKKGDIVCVNVAGRMIVSVNVKTSKVKTVVPDHTLGEGDIYGMKRKDKWLYFMVGGDHESWLMRVEVKTGKQRKILAMYADRYVFSGKKIYYRTDMIDWEHPDNPDTITKYKVMNLNGKNKKKTKIKVKNKRKKSNAKGYSVIRKFDHSEVETYTDEDGTTHEDSNDYYSYYLKKPSGKTVYLATRMEW